MEKHLEAFFPPGTEEHSLLLKVDLDRLPLHIAAIMDGNGRWAQQRGLARARGHRAGAASVREVVEAAARLGIGYLTLYAFSSENWKRPEKEVRLLFGLFQRYLTAERENLVRKDIRISAFGRRDRIPGIVRETLSAAEAATLHCRRLHLRIALDYGARYEIAEAARSLARDVAAQKLPLEQLTEEWFSQSLSSKNIADPDLIIRTAGEQRLSNFLLWQAAYSELCFCSKMWPDFDESDLDEILADFHLRTRKFGALSCEAAR